ncbi:MAG: phosphoglycerate mutase (2,3-diphosphoglycerate-independent) [Bacillota bacterium]
MTGIRQLAAVLRERYACGDQDYWMTPLVRRESDVPVGRICDRDVVVFCCRRGDRETQLTEAFIDPRFDQFPIVAFRDLSFIPFVLYHEKFSHLTPVFAILRPDKTFGEVLSRAGLKQLRVAESEKAAHVTFFFNGRRVDPFVGEDRTVVPSPPSSLFLEKPGTSTAGVAARVEEAIESDEYDFILANLAAGDIIGHLDSWDANVKCAEAVDHALGRICEAALKKRGYCVAVTADHGVLERARHSDGTPSLEHTASLVPFGLICEGLTKAGTVIAQGRTLADVAPSLLEMMKLPIPAEMTGKSLIKHTGASYKCVLVVLDGWGIGSDDPEVNPIARAHTPMMDIIMRNYPFAPLSASGPAVGLPNGRAGNSETGHLTLGAGRMIPQDELRIQRAVEDGTLANSETLSSAFRLLRSRNGKLHVIMLLSEKSSHGNINEGLAVVEAARACGVKDIYVHLILDGRSSPPQGAADLLRLLEREESKESARVSVVTAIGRAYALDRSKSYREKTQLAYRALVWGEGRPF